MSDKSKSWLLFLIGLFSLTQISFIGYIGIAEIACYVIAPFVLWRQFSLFQYLKLLPYLGLLTIWGVCALMVDALVYYKAMEDVLKGVAPVYSVFSVSICVIVLLHDHLRRLNWIIVGMALSYVLSTIIFQRGAFVGAESLMEQAQGSAMEATMSYKLYWLLLIATFAVLPAQIRFRTIPLAVSIGLVLAAAFFSLFGGGRSTFLVLLVSCGLLMVGAGVRSRAYRPRPRSLVVLAILMVLMGLGARSAYTYTVKAGWLGWEEQEKYASQTKIGTSPLAFLMSGRSETFITLLAIRDKPFLGHGSKALDLKGYCDEWVDKYGSEWDLLIAKGRRKAGILAIPVHSHILAAWLWHGLGGLLFWGYALYLIYKTLTVWMWYVPDWFGWFATVIPTWLWAIAFSPFGERVAFAVLMVAALLTRCVYKGLIPPVERGLGGRAFMRG